jgi:chromate transporter
MDDVGSSVSPASTEATRSRIAELVPYFRRLGLLGFGGPVALVGQMERELVDDRLFQSSS